MPKSVKTLLKSKIVLCCDHAEKQIDIYVTHEQYIYIMLIFGTRYVSVKKKMKSYFHRYILCFYMRFFKIIEAINAMACIFILICFPFCRSIVQFARNPIQVLVSLFTVLSTMLSLLGLITTFRLSIKPLKEHGVVSKFLYVKLILLFCDPQKMILGLVVTAGLLPCSPLFHHPLRGESKRYILRRMIALLR